MQLNFDRFRCFFWLTILCIAMPGLALIKAVTILLFWFCLVITSHVKISSLLWFLLMSIMLIVWSGISLFHNFEVSQILNQCSRIFLFFLILSIGAFICRQENIQRNRLDNLILTIALVTMVLKVIIVVGILTGQFTLDAVEKKIGFETVTAGIGLGLQRLQFPSDIVIIFLLPGYSGGRKKLHDIFFLTSVSVVVFLSFSRFLFAAYLFCILIRALWLKKSDLFSWVGLIITAIVVLTFSASLSTRFSSEGTSSSDEARTEQIRQLDSVITVYPFWGTGIGSHVNNYIRSENLPFSYEVEWYAITMQLGIIGMTLFCFTLISLLYSNIGGRKNLFIFLLVFGTWVISGFTNPYIVSLGSAFGLSIFIARCSLASDNRDPVTEDYTSFTTKSLFFK